MHLPVIDSCDDCCACCMEVAAPPFHGGWDERWRDLPQHLRRELLAYDRQRVANEELWTEKPCLWLDLETKRCKHYEHRPQICRDFERGGSECRRMRGEAS